MHVLPTAHCYYEMLLGTTLQPVCRSPNSWQKLTRVAELPSSRCVYSCELKRSLCASKEELGILEVLLGQGRMIYSELRPPQKEYRSAGLDQPSVSEVPWVPLKLEDDALKDSAQDLASR